MRTKYALVTGASGGIGKEMARILFHKGYNLVLVARQGAKLEVVKAEFLPLNPKGSIEVLQADLSTVKGAESVYDFTESSKIEVEVLINNAGSGIYGALEKTDITKFYHMLMLNNYALTCLCKFYSKNMIKKKAGYILNIASLAAYQPVPYIAAYAASKSYVLNFSEAIAMELEEHGVSVTCFSPGHTDTNFFAEANIPEQHQFYGIKTRVSPKKVAENAINSLFNKKLSVIDGFKNSFLGCLNKFSPRKLTARISKMLVKVK
ncbi:MAG TPA: SDR family oxidoreductase [Gammaproteobacteria bacterium]|nr:SDR family oxidoreductase [Gammaproteobacteria bacterium]